MCLLQHLCNSATKRLYHGPRSTSHSCLTTMLPPEAGGPGPGFDLSEVYFLVLHWLSQGPCREAAAALLREVEQQGLLPRTHSFTGGAASARKPNQTQQAAAGKNQSSVQAP